MKKLVIMGGHGNGTVVASTVLDINKEKPQWELLGWLNDFESEPINGLPVLGKIQKAKVEELLEDPEIYFFYALISLKMNHRFLSKLTDLGIPRERFATLVHPTAVVSDHATLGFGTCIQPFVSVGPNVNVGDHVQIDAQSLLSDGENLKNYSFVANNACIGAHVTLEEGAYLGTNCTTLENITLGSWSVAGIGSVVIRDVAAYCTVVGNPARVIKNSSEEK